MRVMLLSSDAPAPRHVNGGTTRQYKLFRRILELGHEVTIVGVFAHREDPYIDELRDEGFTVIPHERPPSRLRETISAIARRPSILLGPFRITMNQVISEIYWVDLKPLAQKALREGDFDVIVIIHEFTAWWIEDLKPAIPAVIEVQELESPQHHANAQRHGGFRGWVRKLAARRSKKTERTWLPRFDGVVTMSTDEAEVLRELVGPSLGPTFAIGNGADTDELATIGPDPGAGVVLFTGTMMFPPNINAAIWLADEVWPLVRARKPEAQLKIVGRVPPPQVTQLGERPGIEVIPDVPSMTPYYAAADVCTLPMHEGGGTRLKLAEAMAAGRAVVSTTNGATGVEVEDGVQLLIEDTPEAFADAIVRLLGDRELREQLGAAGRQRAIERYDWRSLGDRYAEALESVIAGH